MKIKLLGISLVGLLFIGSLHSFAQEAPDEISIHIERIKSAFVAGEISEEEAEAKIDELLKTTKDDDGEDWEGDEDRGEKDEDWFEDIPDDVLTEIKRIKSAFAAGEISEAKAEAKIDELLETIKDDDDQDWEDAEKGEGSIIVKGEGLISEIPFALIESLLEMMAAIDWDNISDWIQVGLEIDQLFEKEWDEGENLEVKKKMKNQIIGELKSSPQTLIKDLSKQANNKSASAKLKYELTIRSGSGILIMKFEGHLQTAPTPIGPWTDIEATESFEVQADIGSAFFRSKK